MNKIKTAIIGMGKMGKIRYETLKNHNGFEVVAVCDVNKENIIDFEKKKYNYWHECLDAQKYDAVFVCTYNNVISDIVCEALKKGCHVFSEKPPGRNLDDTKRMKQAFEQTSDQILKFGFNHRLHNSVIEAKALVESGILGDIVCARGIYGKAGCTDFAQQWRSDKKISGGGILLDQGIHMLDLLYYFLGTFTEIKGTVDNLIWKEVPMEDNALAILKTSDGKVASLHSSAIQWRHKFNLELICTKGFISLDGLITSTNSYGEEMLTFVKKDLLEQTGRLGKPSKQVYFFEKDDSWALELEEFYNAITKKIDKYNGNINDAVSIMSFIEQIYKWA